jgi:hypothetical protein
MGVGQILSLSRNAEATAITLVDESQLANRQ